MKSHRLLIADDRHIAPSPRSAAWRGRRTAISASTSSAAVACRANSVSGRSGALCLLYDRFRK
ncbi:hypothetical protein [Actinoplanes sp. HUAS TT8]|uniref:hypothetical protein n=1 Tax=Actinoplanes sp. HUAS TT8 TaxID=3447453 RepID=UPI003F51DFDB